MIPLFNIQSILAAPTIYRFFNKIIGFEAAMSLMREKYIHPQDGDRILDIGCGTCDILQYLPDVEYIGFDINQKYIDAAIKRHGNRGTIICKKVSRDAITESSSFDLVIAIGVLHHLNDEEATQLFELAKSVLKSTGRIITYDGCYVKEQSNIARFILSKDRGQYVRKREEYLYLASKIFTNIKATIHHDLIRIPYTHIILECTL